jgi:hypothetical protein
MDPDEKPFFGCKFFDDQDPNAPAQDDQPWTFNPTVPQPPSLNLPLPGPAQTPSTNPYLQPIPPLPGAPAPSLPGPAQLFPNQGPDLPAIPTPGGPLQLMPWFHSPDFPFDNMPDGPEKPQDRAPIPDGN